jgi:hypothetical protein
MAKAKAGKGKEKEVLVVGSKVKAYIKGKGFMSSGDLLEALTAKVACLLDDATLRTKANKRSTVRGTDL